jgi:hypothetical protein
MCVWWIRYQTQSEAMVGLDQLVSKGFLGFLEKSLPKSCFLEKSLPKSCFLEKSLPKSCFLEKSLPKSCFLEKSL